MYTDCDVFRFYQSILYSNLLCVQFSRFLFWAPVWASSCGIDHTYTDHKTLRENIKALLEEGQLDLRGPEKV